MVITELQRYQVDRTEPTFVVASGNSRKINGYSRYPGIIASLDPEKDGGQPEPDYPQAERVAWSKTEVVRQILDDLWPEGHPFIIIANDLTTKVSRTLEGLNRPGQHRDLLKLDRQVQAIKSPENLDAFTKWATLDALAMYCNGQFFVKWQLGFAGQVPEQNISAVSSIDIVGCFNPLDESDVYTAFNEGTAYTIGPRVQLAELAAKYANEVYIDDETARGLEVAQLQNLVMEGVVPWTSFEHLLKATPVQDRRQPYVRVKVPLT